jgi:tyrosine aminotransferase
MANGYAPSSGLQVAKESVAQYQSRLNGKMVRADDIVIASGASGALALAIEVLMDEGIHVI